MQFNFRLESGRQFLLLFHLAVNDRIRRFRTEQHSPSEICARDSEQDGLHDGNAQPDPKSRGSEMSRGKFLKSSKKLERSDPE